MTGFRVTKNSGRTFDKGEVHFDFNIDMDDCHFHKVISRLDLQSLSQILDIVLYGGVRSDPDTKFHGRNVALTVLKMFSGLRRESVPAETVTHYLIENIGLSRDEAERYFMDLWKVGLAYEVEQGKFKPT